MSTNDTNESVSGGEDFRTLEKFAEDSRTKDNRSDVIEAVPALYMRASIYLFGVVVIVTLILAYVSKVYVIVPSKGSIIPEGQGVVVEAESPGIITDLKVSLGDTVEAGQILMELRQDAAGVGLTTLRDQLKLQEGNLNKARKAAAQVQELLTNPGMIAEKSMDALSDAGPSLVYIGGIRNILQKRDQLRIKEKVELVRQKQMMDAQIALQKTTITSLKRTEQSNIAAIETTRKTIELKKQNLERTSTLAESRILTEQEVNLARDALLAAQTTLNQQVQALSETRLNINRAKLEISNQRNTYETARRDLFNQIDETNLAYDKALSDLTTSVSSLNQAIKSSEAKISEIKGRLRLQEDTINKLTIKSPVNGEITGLKFNSKGQLVGAGSRVAVIIPTDVRPIIMLTVPNKDIAGVREGIDARVKVVAYPFRQYGTVKATVTRVFPMLDKPFFNVRLRLEKKFINVNGKPAPLEPGLDVNVDLLTERKRILELIFKKMS